MMTSTTVSALPAPIARWNMERVKKIVRICAENTYFTLVMTVLTIWALFDDDLRISLTETNQGGDVAFETIISIAFFLFVLEILMASFYKESYLNLPELKKFSDPSWKVFLLNFVNFGSFYFWLDCIATFSLVTEVI